MFFEHVSMIGWIAGVSLGTIAFVLRSRTGAWYSLLSVFSPFCFSSYTSSLCFSNFFGATARAGPLPPVPLFGLICLYLFLVPSLLDAFVAAVAHSNAAIYSQSLLTTNPPANR